MTVTRSSKSKPVSALEARHLALRPGEKVFADCVMDLKEIVVLDGIDLLPHGFRVRCHYLHGQLPGVVIENSGDIFLDKDRLGIAACKLISVVCLREEVIHVWLVAGFSHPPR